MAEPSARHVVISGASAGLGRALALAYARPGVTLGLIGRDRERIEAAAAACRARGAEVQTGVLDVREAAATAAWLDAFDARHPIGLLIAMWRGQHDRLGGRLGRARAHRAGGRHQLLRRAPHRAAGARAHARAPRRPGGAGQFAGRAARHGDLARLLREQGGDQGLGDSVRPLLARDGVRVTVVLPGFVKTAMSDVFPGDKPFLWSAERAAAHIHRGLDAGRSEIAFPALLAFGMRLLPLLPAALADAILGRLSYLPAEDAAN